MTAVAAQKEAGRISKERRAMHVRSPSAQIPPFWGPCARRSASPTHAQVVSATDVHSPTSASIAIERETPFTFNTTLRPCGHQGLGDQARALLDRNRERDRRLRIRGKVGESSGGSTQKRCMVRWTASSNRSDGGCPWHATRTTRVVSGVRSEMPDCVQCANCGLKVSTDDRRVLEREGWRISGEGVPNTWCPACVRALTAGDECGGLRNQRH